MNTIDQILQKHESEIIQYCPHYHSVSGPTDIRFNAIKNELQLALSQSCRNKQCERAIRQGQILDELLIAGEASFSQDAKRLRSERVSLRVALLLAFGTDHRHSLLDASEVVRMCFGEVSMDIEAAKELIMIDWRKLPISDVQRLRALKLALAPIVAIRSMLSEEALQAVDPWIVLKSQLP